MDPPPVVQEGVPAGPQYHYAPKNSPELIDHVGLAPWVDPGQWPCSTVRIRHILPSRCLY